MNANELNLTESENLNLGSAKLAYTIINRLLEHNTAVSELVSLMARVIDEDTQRALTATPPWTAYLESRRELETTRAQIEKFTAELKKLEIGELK